MFTNITAEHEQLGGGPLKRKQTSDHATSGFKLFISPYDFPIDEVPTPLQMELVELQYNDEFKAKYRTASPLSFHDLVFPSNKIPNYIEHVKRIFVMFGSTYCCEQLFSKMKYTKSRFCSQLNDRHLNDILLLSTSSIDPGIE